MGCLQSNEHHFNYNQNHITIKWNAIKSKWKSLSFHEIKCKMKSKLSSWINFMVKLKTKGNYELRITESGF